MPSENRIEETLLPWLQRTLDLFLPYLPSSTVIEDIQPITALPPPIYTLRTEESTVDTLIDHLDLSTEPKPNGLEPTAANAEAGPSRPGRRGSQGYEPNGLGKQTRKADGWTWARLRKNERVTKTGWWQDVREIELEFEEDGDHDRLVY